MLIIRSGVAMGNSEEVDMSKNLYRDPQRGALGGVCAGLADYLGVEVWVVRLVAVTALIFASFLTMLLYLAAWAMLDKRPSVEGGASASYGAAQLKQQGWQQGLMPHQALDRTAQQLDALERRLQAMERCVTSKEYQLRRDLQRL